MPTICTSIPFSAPSEVTARSVSPSPTFTFIDLRHAGADQRFDFAAGFGIEIASAEPAAVLKPRLLSATGSTALPMKTPDFDAVGEHAVELDARRHAAHMPARD